MAEDNRNLNPHKPARIAMILFNAQYGRQGGGSMDFWGSLKEVERKCCRELLKEIDSSPIETV